MKYNRSETIYNGRKIYNITPANDSFIITVVKQIVLFLLTTGILVFLFSLESIVDLLMGM